jgi:hypothetical protein
VLILRVLVCRCHSEASVAVYGLGSIISNSTQLQSPRDIYRACVSSCGWNGNCARAHCPIPFADPMSSASHGPESTETLFFSPNSQLASLIDRSLYTLVLFFCTRPYILIHRSLSPVLDLFSPVPRNGAVRPPESRPAQDGPPVSLPPVMRSVSVAEPNRESEATVPVGRHQR